MGEFFVVRSAAAWSTQAHAALAQIDIDCGGAPPATIAEGANISPVAFGRLIEALVALAPLTGQMPSQELIELAGLRPANEVFG